VAAKLDGCYSFTPDHTCPPGQFQVSYTSDGSTGTLYAVTALQTTGDSCSRASVWFFDDATPIALVSDLPPMNAVETTDPDRNVPGASDLSNTLSFVLGTVSAMGTAEFAVPYAVSAPVTPGGVSCADVGHAGTDTYVYRWNGTTMTYVSGAPPASPLVIGLGPSSAGTSTLPQFEACAYGASEDSAPPRIPPSIKPTGFQYNCGAAHPYSWLQDLTWTTWNTTIATGHGTFASNTCTPDCAAGNLEYRPASIELSDPARMDGFLLFTRMDIAFEGEEAPKPIAVTIPGQCPSYGGVGC
jgi:hypothetical protein